MAVRTILKDAYDRIVADNLTMRDRMAQLRDFTAANPISGNQIIALHEAVLRHKARLVQVRDLPGIAAHAAAAEGQPLYDVVAEFNALMAEMDALRDFMVANVDTTNWVTFTAGGVNTKSFTSAQTAPLRTRLDAVIAVIS